MMQLARALAPALLALSLSGCATMPDAPFVEGVPAAAGSPVALGQAVSVGGLIATPMAVVEDSRCPINARCVWAGRLVVTTRIDGSASRETVDLTLGEPFGTHGAVIALSSGNPAPETGRVITNEEYRFTFESK